MRWASGFALAIVLAAGTVAFGQGSRIASPAGRSATQIGGRYDQSGRYFGGKWIEILYGRPIKRGRALFGPPDFAQKLNAGAPVWRAGANVSTRLRTDVALLFDGVLVEPGEYTVFIELRRDLWTFILSTWPAQTKYDQHDRDALFGAFHYRPHRDVLRTTMNLAELPHSFDQLSWQFLDMSDDGGTLAIFWDTKMASVRFEIPDRDESDRQTGRFR